MAPNYGSSHLETGANTLDAFVYSATGDLKYTPLSTALVVTQAPLNLALVTSPNPSTFGQVVTLTATATPADATGTVGFYSDLELISFASLSNGVASLTTTGLTVRGSPHYLSVGYSDQNYILLSANSVTQTVNQITTSTSLQAAPPTSPVGQTVTLTATVSPSTATGNVTFKDGATAIGSAALSGGTASILTSSLSIGSHSLTASYGGDTNDSVSASSAVTETVSQIATTTSLQGAPLSSTAGQAVVLTATVSPSSATGTVTFLDGPTSIGSAALNGGAASISTSSLSTGNHSLTASYSGDANDFPSASSAVTESVAQPAATTTTTALAASPNPSAPGQSVTLTATVTPAAATGSVSFIDSGALLGTGALNNGVATLSTAALSAGSHSLTASYAGNATYATSTSPPVTESVGQLTATTTVLTTAPNPSTPGQNVTFTATVTPAAATGTVSFLDAANLLGTGPLANGVAAFSTAALSAGSHSLTASYAGNATYATSTSPPVTESVGQLAATTTVLTTAPNPSTPGQNVTLTATVTPAAATGTVSFLDGGNLLGTGPLANGAATFSTSSLSTATHSLTASYAGDANNAPGTSAAVNQSVTAASGRSITSLVPATAGAGGAAFTLIVNGAGFSSGAVVQWNAIPLGTTFVSATQVTASVPANLIASPGTVTITVVTTGGSIGGATFQVTSQGQPTPVSETPASGVGNTQTFTFQFSDAAGYQNLGVVNVLINNFLDGRGACYLAYVVPSNTLVLVDDGGDAGGPYAGSVVLGSSGAIQNSQCAVTLVSAVGNGSTLTIFLNITFKPAFGGNRVMYMAARDLGAGNSNWQALGVWQVPFTPSGTIVVTSVSPGRGAAPSATSQEFLVTLTDTRGAGDFGVVDLLINNFIDGRQACYLAYVAASGALILLDDTGDAAGPYAGSMALNGGAASIQNSQCLVSGAGSAVSSVANTLTLTLNVTFKAGFSGNRVVYAAGRDGAGGNNTDWQALGTSTVQ